MKEKDNAKGFVSSLETKIISFLKKVLLYFYENYKAYKLSKIYVLFFDISMRT